MGLDMICYIRNKEGVNLTDNLVDFRDSEFFCEVMGEGDRIEYQILSDIMVYNEELFSKEQEEEKEARKEGYTAGNYGFKAISVKDFKEWFNKYKPYKRAGYVPRYDYWLYVTKGIVPYEDKVEFYVSKEEIEERDLVFLEYFKDDFMTELNSKVTELCDNYVKDLRDTYLTTPEAIRYFQNNTYICIYFNR